MFDFLKGLRVLDLTTVVLGPMATQILGDLGAEVIKVEALDGDVSRFSGAQSPDGTGALYANNNRNKRSIALDLKSDGGKRVLADLVRTADVFVHNIRPKAIARLGFSASDVRALNPATIYVAAVGFGSAGPYAGRPAYDDVIQAVSGVAALPAEVGRDPAYVPSIIADKIAALYVVQAVLVGLLQRHSTGRGLSSEVPMFEALVSFLMNEHLGEATYKTDGTPGYSRLLNPNRRPYRTADGWLAVMPYSEGQWRAMLDAMERTDITSAAWFQSGAERNRRSEELYGILADALTARSTDEWIPLLEHLDVPHARINGFAELLDDPHLTALGFFEPTDTMPGRVRSVGQPIVFEDRKAAPDLPPPALGADGDSILRSLGMDGARIDQLRATGVLK